MGIIIENPGILTTVQDEGRFGYQQFGEIGRASCRERVYREV